MDVVRRQWKPEPPPGVRHAYASRPPEGARLLPAGENLVSAGRTVLVNVPLDRYRGLARWLPGAFERVKWDGTSEFANEFRLAGFKNAHRTFGVSAPQPLRRRFGCSRCTFDRGWPDIADALRELSGGIYDLWAEQAPDEAKAHARLVEASILPEWRMPGPWTSGIINRTAALPYHRDSGNLRGSWSAMLIVRNRTSGGHLHVPEFDVWLECEDLAVVIFDGQGAWHGVTPVDLRAGGYRYSMVWYAKEGVTKCGPAADEVARAQREATRDRS